MAKGHIKYLVPERSFGIIDTEGYSNLFFDGEEVQDSKFSELTVGQEVEFDLDLERGRQQAVNVRIPKSGNES